MKKSAPIAAAMGALLVSGPMTGEIRAKSVIPMIPAVSEGRERT